MKLVELLAKELNEWAAGKVAAVQDPDADGTVWFVSSSDGLEFNGLEWRYYGYFEIAISRPSSRAEDYDSAIVTRAQWQAERDLQNGGEWKRHRGGKQPVDNDVYVEVHLRCGDIHQSHAQDFIWPHKECDRDANLTKYRVISQPQAEEVEVKDTTIGTLSYKVEIDTSPAIQALNELSAKWDQVESPFKWRDCVNELDAYIEKFTRERDELIERLASEGFALIGSRE